MEISIDDGGMRQQMEKIKKSLSLSALAGGEAATKKMAEKLAAHIRSLIPDKGGWYDTYRSGIKLVEITPGQFELSASLTELKFDKIEAATTLLWFGGGDEVARLLGNENPWTVDTIPSVDGGFRSDIILRPGSESEVDFHRRKQASNMTSIVAMLQRLGKKVDPNGLPSVNGRVMADVPFLARRLEYGLGGFPRTQIWGRLPTDASNMSDDRDIADAADDAFTDDLNRRLQE